MTNPLPYVKAVPPGTGKPAIGKLLQDAEVLTPVDVENILLLQRERPLRFGEAAQRLGLADEGDIQRALAQQFDYCYLTPGEGNLAPELSAVYRPFDKQVEAMRTLRGRLFRSWFSAGRQELVVAAANPGDGASLMAANLAVSYAQQGYRTLLIDANLRRPRQHAIFNIHLKHGLADMLADRSGPEAVLRHDLLPSLSLLCAGTPAPNPLELLNRRSFIALREPIRAHYDVILYDAPSFAEADDVFSIAARAGGVLVVARKHRTTVADMQSIGLQLREGGIAVAGSVLNEF